MDTVSSDAGLNRRSLLAVGLGVAGAALASPNGLAAMDALSEADLNMLRRLLGAVPGESPRVRLEMPAVFRNGYSVPLALAVDSPMTEADHVKLVHVLAPRNPIIIAALFHFGPASGRAAIATRIRLSQPQNVIAVAEMNDGARLMARTWVSVETDGCA